MAIESTFKDYQRRKAREKERADKPAEYGPSAPQFQPRAVKVKKEPAEEMDFSTRMKMLSKGKASLKKSVFGIKKEDPDIKEEPGLKKKKKRRKRYSSSSEDSEEEDRRITRKAKKKLGLSVRYLM